MKKIPSKIFHEGQWLKLKLAVRDLLTIGQLAFVAKNAKRPNEALIPVKIESLSLTKGTIGATVWVDNKEFDKKRYWKQIKEAVENKDEEALKKIPAPILKVREHGRSHIGVKTLKDNQYLSRRFVFVVADSK